VKAGKEGDGKDWGGDRAWRFLHNPDAKARGEGESFYLNRRNPLKSPDSKK
jgi:hypothetical protein